MATAPPDLVEEPIELQLHELRSRQTPLKRTQGPFPHTPRRQESPPALTPGSVVSEVDPASPATPGLPSTVRTSSYFSRTSLPLKLEQRTVKVKEEQSSAEKNIWDISFGDTSTKAWLFRECQKLDSWSAPSGTPVAFHADFDFASSGQKLSNTSAASDPLIGSVKPSQCASQKVSSAGTVQPTASTATKPIQTTTSQSLDQSLLRVLPTDLISRLEKDDGHCVAQTTGNSPRRCRQPQRLAGIDADVITSLLDGRDLSTSEDVISILRKIGHILPAVLCNSGKHRKRAESALESVVKQLRGPTDAELSKITGEVGTWLRRLASNTPEPQRPVAGALKAITASTRPQLRRSDRIAGKSPAIHTVSVTYEPYYTSTSRNGLLSAPELIRQMLLRRLKATETTPGYLYVFWRKGDFGLVKIGYSKHPPSVRLDQWQKQCGDDAQACESTVDKSLQMRVRNVRRLENLVHAELKEYRRKQLGCRCGKMHKEWFQVDIKLVQLVVEKWTTWLREQPRYLLGSLVALDDGEMSRLCTAIQLSSSVNLATPAPPKRLSSRLGHRTSRTRVTPSEKIRVAVAAPA